MPAYLTISGIKDPLVKTTQEAITLRDSLLEETATVVRVADEAQAAIAGDILTRSKQLTRFIELARQDAKEAPLKLCRDIDSHAKELTVTLDAEAKRVGQVLAAFQTEQNRIAEEKRQAAAAEARRIQQEAERVAREEAEKARKEYEEKIAAAARAHKEANAEKRRQEAEAIRADYEAQQGRRDEEARSAMIATKQAAVMAAPVKVAGIATRKVLKFQITSMSELYGASPFFVKMEANTQALTAALKQLDEGQHIPGVKHWYESESVVR